MQTPSVGRIVHYYLAGGALPRPYADVMAERKPIAAMITEVHSDTCVNLISFESGRDPFTETSVDLVEPDGECRSSSFCIWPPRV